MTLENKATAISKGGEPEQFITHADLIMAACNFVDGQGCSLAEQRIRFKLIDCCEAADGQIEIDPKYIQILKQVVNNCKFRIVHKDLAAFAEVIENIS